MVRVSCKNALLRRQTLPANEDDRVVAGFSDAAANAACAMISGTRSKLRGAPQAHYEPPHPQLGSAGRGCRTESRATPVGTAPISGDGNNRSLIEGDNTAELPASCKHKPLVNGGGSSAVYFCPSTVTGEQAQSRTATFASASRHPQHTVVTARMAIAAADTATAAAETATAAAGTATAAAGTATDSAGTATAAAASAPRCPRQTRRRRQEARRIAEQSMQLERLISPACPQALKWHAAICTTHPQHTLASRAQLPS